MTGSPRIARRYLVAGRVQGVGFRYFTERCAVHERIAGWVRNLPDGRVEIEAEGDGDAMTRFEAAVRSGPRGGRVDHVDVDALSLSSARQGFQVR